LRTRILSKLLIAETKKKIIFLEGRQSLPTIFAALAIVFSLTFSVSAQDLPGKIRGYKVYKEKIVVVDETGSKVNDNSKVEIKMENPEFADISASGVKLEVGGEITVFGQSGTIDFITFSDFQINGVKVEIEEYRERLDFQKNTAFKLKKPLEVFVSHAQTLRAAWKEAANSRDEWLVEGKVFVFGRFRKFGFNFKRVIPVEVKIKIPNPVKAKLISASFSQIEIPIGQI
jgi:hypothetical protein